MEIKINAKFPGHGDVNFEFSCTEQETAMLIQDPVYQALGMKLVNEISFKPQPEQQKHNENLRRQMEVMQHTMQILEKRIESFKKHNSGF